MTWKKQNSRYPRDLRLGHRPGKSFIPIDQNSGPLKDLYTDERGFVSLNSSNLTQDVSNKQLIVILGGSVAMGLGASSNEKTICSVLNKFLMKEKVNFVVLNAACAAYCSWQELIRFSLEISDLKPKYVISISSYNDFVHSSMGSKFDGSWKKNHDRSIDDLAFYLNINFPEKFSIIQLLKIFFLKFNFVKKFIILKNRLFGIKITKKDIEWGYTYTRFKPRLDGVNNYIHNIRQIYAITKEFKGKFHCFLQPYPNINDKEIPKSVKFDLDNIEKINPEKKYAQSFFYNNLYNQIVNFDFFSRINLQNKFFVDHIHLNDSGQEEVAKIILEYILKKEI